MKISKQQIGIIIIAALVATAIAHYDELLPYRWQAFSSPDGKFAVELPGKPTLEDLHAPLADGGTATIHEVSAKPSNQTAYSITYWDDPRLLKNSTGDVLDAVRDGSIKNVQGTLIAEKQLTVDGYPARDIQAHARGNSLLDARAIAIGNRVFMLMVVDTSRQTRDAKNIQRFVDSFKPAPR